MSENSKAAPQKSGRALKKERTRAALIQAAMELFAELGYADTTMTAVAARANLHVQTLYKHFSTKEELAVAPDRELLNRFKSAVKNRNRQQPISSFWRDWAVRSSKDTVTKYRDQYLERRQFSAGSPSIIGYTHSVTHEYVELLEIELAAELQIHPRNSLYPRLFAGMLMDATGAATTRWVRNLGECDLAAEVGDGIDDACELIRMWVEAKGTS